MTYTTQRQVHFHRSDARFCGTTETMRRFPPDPNDVTCQQCKNRDTFVLSESLAQRAALKLAKGEA